MSCSGKRTLISIFLAMLALVMSMAATSVWNGYDSVCYESTPGSSVAMVKCYTFTTPRAALFPTTSSRSTCTSSARSRRVEPATSPGCKPWPSCSTPTLHGRCPEGNDVGQPPRRPGHPLGRDGDGHPSRRRG
ncbi:hypothetical protein Cni_G12413 [Canna indica]|uniref:Uncharacterized protein n=1 Tax=Canna indica TaxID=4628 RepID=A0AAQ3K7T1_9LILI|nr:hypothetical protein Cni_G12413 [Canna indica]